MFSISIKENEIIMINPRKKKYIIVKLIFIYKYIHGTCERQGKRKKDETTYLHVAFPKQ